MCIFQPKIGSKLEEITYTACKCQGAGVGVADLEITAFWPLFDPLYGWIGTPPVISTFLPIFWATCWYLILWENIEWKGWRGEKPENPGIGRFPQYLKSGDLLDNQFFLSDRNTIRRRAEKEIGGLAPMGREKWPLAWVHSKSHENSHKIVETPWNHDPSKAAISRDIANT